MGPKNSSIRRPLEANLGLTLFLGLLLLFSVCSPWAPPSKAAECDSCISCHGSIEDIHGNFDHQAAPTARAVVLFADYTHDSAAWVNPSPQFGVLVSCSVCHDNDLPAIHGNDCGTCHPTPYGTLGTWNKGCQQGGCHAAYHQDAKKAHLPFENARDPTNDCSRCHEPSFEGVPQYKCLSCHANYGAGDLSPPTTVARALASYIGPAKVDFSITDNGKVGVGRTFYKLDGGPVVAAGKSLFVGSAGSHRLEYWSVDQSGNAESPTANVVLFSTTSDTTPPTTTSDAQPTYTQGAVINLTATDNGTLGVKTTYYQLNEGAAAAGTKVVIPATAGTIAYTLKFWSEDWAGNVETANTASFTVSSGGGTIRLVWGDSDLSGSPCPGDPEANAAWRIRAGSPSGPVVASGYDGCPGWSGFNDVALPIGATSYYVVVDWWNSYEGFDEQTAFAPVTLTSPGQVIRLSY